MYMRTLTWGFLAFVLALALSLSGSMLSRAVAEPTAGLAPAQGDTAEEAAAAAGSVASWRSNGPYGGNVQALALSPAFNTDGYAFAGGWLGDGSTGGYGIMRTTDGGATWATYPIAPSEDFFITYELAASPAYGSDQTLFATGPDRMARRSTDGGVTWSAVGGPAPSYGLAMSPSYGADGTAWLTYRFREGVGDGMPDSGVTRTTNRGTTWSLATAGLPGDYDVHPHPAGRLT